MVVNRVKILIIATGLFYCDVTQIEFVIGQYKFEVVLFGAFTCLCRAEPRVCCRAIFSIARVTAVTPRGVLNYSAHE